MKVSIDDVRKRLTEKGLKVTPQRMAILDAVYTLGRHPTAENILEYIRKNNPNIASGTVYKVLETLIEHNLIKKVTTDKDVMRYDGNLENHHHLYGLENDTIEDYVDTELDGLLQEYFKKHKIKGFNINELVLHIKGTFDKE